MLPVFSCAFIVGILAKLLFRKVGVEEHLSKPIIGHLSGAFTDYLVAFGVLVGARIHQSSPFEKSIFTWGWFTGTMAMGIALLRITDPDSKSGTLDDYAFAYLYIAPVEIALVSLSPLAFCNGFGWLFVGICALVGIGILAYAALRGWFKRSSV